MRIQTTPENSEKDGGGFGTWVVVSLALGVLLGLILVPPLLALRQAEAISRDLRASQQQFEDSHQVLQAVSQDVFAISIAVREFLLDNSPDAGRTYRVRVGSARDQLRANLNRLRTMLPPDERPVLEQLQGQVDAYLDTVVSVFDWTPQQRTDRAAYFLRQEQRPRRESVLASADRLAEVSTTLYAAQQRRTTDSENRFRRDLTRSAVTAFAIGLAVSCGGILRMRTLERRARQHRQRAEQTGDEMRNLSVRLRQAQEEERKTISRELHDEVGQQLTALRMELGALERQREAPAAEFKASLAEVKSLAERSLRLVRDIATGLRPSVLDDLGLEAALHRHAREFSKRTGTPVTLAVDAACEDLDERQRTNVYRIVQEALTNCAKHARASQIQISMVDRTAHKELVVQDDGVGFDPAVLAHHGLGLIGMEERARELGGTVAVVSTRGSGTTIRLTVPRAEEV